MSAEDRDQHDTKTSGAGAVTGHLQSAGSNDGSRSDVIDALQDLVECCKDGEYGFRKSAERAQGAQLKPLLARRADEFRAAGEELNRLVVALGGRREDSGSALGAVHRGWVAVQTALGDNDKAVLEGCERGQDNALARYRKALDKPLPADIRSVVERQLQQVRECHDEMKQLRDQARAA